MEEIVIINGPNLNLLGTREKQIYGDISLESFSSDLTAYFPHCRLIFRQSNVEGELINLLHQFGFGCKGIVLNPGGYSHTSVAIADAIRAIETPVVEVHLSNVHGREDFRQKLLTGAACRGVISGLGLEGYRLAISYLLNPG